MGGYLKRESNRRYAITARPFNPDELQKLQSILAKRAERGKFDATGLIRALECAIIEYGRKSRPTVTGTQVKKELRAVAKVSEALSRRLDCLTRTAWLELEIGIAQSFLDAYLESRCDDWERTEVDRLSFPNDVPVDTSLLRHLAIRAAKASETCARSFEGRGRSIDLEHPARGLIFRIHHVLRKYGIPTSPNGRTTFEAVLRVAFFAAGLGAIKDPLAIAKRVLP